MKWFVSTALRLLVTVGFVAALRGSDNSVETHPVRRHLLEEGTECVTYMRIMDYDDGPDVEDWCCQFSRKYAKRFGGAFMVEIGGLTKEKMNRMGAVSGGTVLRVGTSSYVETRESHNVFAAKFDSNWNVGKPPVLHVAPEDFVIEEMDEDVDARHYKYRRAMRERRHRRLAQSTGTLETLVIRVVDVDDNEPPSAKKLENDIFLDEVSLKKQYGKCSHDNIEIKQIEGEGLFATVDGDTVEGIVDIRTNDKASSTSTYTMWVNAVNDAESEYDRDFSEVYDLVMVCEPNGTFDSRGSTGWIAYAYMNHYISVYNDEWCSYISAQMHEVGK